MNVDKGLLYTRSQEVAETARGMQWVDMPQITTTGIVLMGAPVGEDDFILAHLNTRVQKADELARLIEQVPCKQSQLLLLRKCVATRLGYFFRLTSPRVNQCVAESFAETLWQAVARLLCLESDTDTDIAFDIENVKHQVSLPLRHGGLGMRSFVGDHAIAAFLTSVLAAARGANNDDADADGEADINAMPEKVQEEMARMWSHLSEAMPALEQEHPLYGVMQREFPLVSSEVLKILTKQTMLSRPMDDKAAAQWRANVRFSPPVKARLHSVAGPFASMWLEAVPGHQPLCFSDADFVTALRYRLGLPILGARLWPDRCTGCAGPVDVLGHHLVTCTRMGYATRKHTIVCRAWAELIRQHHRVSLEVACFGASDSRIDLAFESDGGAVVADVSFVDPSAASAVSGTHAAFARGAAASRREVEKHVRYDSEAGHAGLRFIPLVAETFGLLGQEACAFFRRLREMAVRVGTSAAFFSSYWGAYLSVAAQRSQAALLNAASAKIQIAQAVRCGEQGVGADYALAAAADDVVVAFAR